MVQRFVEALPLQSEDTEISGMQISCTRHIRSDRRHVMKWETPSASDMRFGFEVTMYIASR